MKFSRPSKTFIAVIIFAILIIIAVATIVVLVLGKNTLSPFLGYYNGSFRITNLNFKDEYKNRQSDGFKSISVQIEELLTKTFENSDIKSQYNGSKVTSISSGSVIPVFVLIFYMANTVRNNVTTDFVKKVLTDNMKNTSGNTFTVDQNSLMLSEMPVQVAQNILSTATNMIITTTATTQIPEQRSTVPVKNAETTSAAANTSAQTLTVPSLIKTTTATTQMPEQSSTATSLIKTTTATTQMPEQGSTAPSLITTATTQIPTAPSLIRTTTTTTQMPEQSSTATLRKTASTATESTNAQTLTESTNISSTTTTTEISTTSSNVMPVTTLQAAAENFKACGVGGPSAVANRIVGGTNAAVGSWPWQAGLRYNKYYICGASLISDTWLVTAAHCIISQVPSLFTVILGTILSTSSSVLYLESIIVHEKYTRSTSGNDIALLKLSIPLKFTRYIGPVCLPQISDIFADGLPCYITGWGTLSEGGSVSITLQEAEVKIIGTETCNSSQMYKSMIGPSMICAGYVDGNIDSCQGDSGGPLVAKKVNDTSWYLIGIVSFGEGCARVNKPGVYSRVTYLRSWITQKTGI
ncbi:transmembrane protease serine 11D isoform X2 [Xenopus laevis]|uniref:Transmembrane protease serine 11D isoform X2 n=1 Tax=Xenopus laevis TaxID=8355 RepID=A0A8J1N1K5_XENLA|nr:transmembrane protease serine 11D isoform X2 [Xenopus laevis]